MSFYLHSSKPIGHTTQRLRPSVNHGIHFIMYQYWFIDSNKCTILMDNVNNRENQQMNSEGMHRNSLYVPVTFSVTEYCLKKEKKMYGWGKWWSHSSQKQCIPTREALDKTLPGMEKIPTLIVILPSGRSSLFHDPQRLLNLPSRSFLLLCHLPWHIYDENRVWALWTGQRVKSFLRFPW